MNMTLSDKTEMLGRIMSAVVGLFHHWWIWLAVLIGAALSYMTAFAGDHVKTDREAITLMAAWIPIYLLLIFTILMWTVGGPILGHYHGHDPMEAIWIALVMGTIGSMFFIRQVPLEPLAAVIFVVLMLAWPLLDALLFPSSLSTGILLARGLWITGTEFLVMMTAMIVPAVIGLLIGFLGMKPGRPDTEQGGKRIVRILLMVFIGSLLLSLPLKISAKASLFSEYPAEVWLTRIAMFGLFFRAFWSASGIKPRIKR